MAAALSRICLRMEPPEAEGFPEPSLSAPGDPAESARHRPGVPEAPSCGEPWALQGALLLKAFLSLEPGLGVPGDGEGPEESRGAESAGSR